MARITYNPWAYVRGGASPAVARSTQLLGWGKTKPPPRPASPLGRPDLPAAKPAVDPLVARSGALAESLFAPLFAKLGAQKAAAEANTRAAYQAHSDALAAALKTSGAAIPQAYDTGIASSAAVNDALANRLSGVGAEAADSLKTKLAQISADPAAAASLAQMYTAAGNAGYAKDSADLQHLIGQRTEAAAYQGKLPGIGRLAATQGLESAMANLRGEFGQQEAGLRDRTAAEISARYTDLRAEKLQRERDAQAAVEARLDRLARERASLRALAASAATNAEKLRYQAQEKALDRQAKLDIANINAQVRRDTDNPAKPSAVTGPANQPWISVDGIATKNPNWHGTWKGDTPVPPKKDQAGSTSDTWKTPGSSKRNRVEQRAWNAVVSPEGGWSQDVLRKLRKYPRSADAIINTAINKAMRSAGVDNPNDPSAREIRNAIRTRLSGRTWKVPGYDDPFTFEVGKTTTPTGRG